LGDVVEAEIRARVRAIRGPLRLLAAVFVCLGAAGPAAAQFGPATPLISGGVLLGAAEAGTCSDPFLIGEVPVLFMEDTTGAPSNTGGGIGGPFPCGPENETPGPEHVYQFTVTAMNDLTFQVTPDMGSDYDPTIYILSECGNENSCVAFEDTGDEGQGEVIGPLQLSPGSYYFYVDSFFGILPDARAEGPYELQVVGSLAVELIEFSIE
jgi:hypothetical protein